MNLRDDIVRAARGWLGTRFHHQGRLKKSPAHPGGVDCLGLLVGVARELELKDGAGRMLYAQDECDYSHQPDTQRLMTRLKDVLIPIPRGSIAEGYVVLLKIDGSPQHLGIIGRSEVGLTLIHAYAPARAVVEHALEEWWLQRIEAVFTI